MWVIYRGKWLISGPVLQTLPSSWLSKIAENLRQNCVEKEITVPNFEEPMDKMEKTKSTDI